MRGVGCEEMARAWRSSGLDAAIDDYAPLAGATVRDVGKAWRLKYGCTGVDGAYCTGVGGAVSLTCSAPPGYLSGGLASHSDDSDLASFELSYSSPQRWRPHRVRRPQCAQA